MNYPESITEEEIRAILDDSEITYEKKGKKTTVAHAILPNGFEVTAYSGVNNPDRYDLEIGKYIAHDKLVSKVWELESYHRHSTN